MSIWVVLVSRNAHLSNAETPHKLITTREYLQAPNLFGKSRPYIINLSASYGYQTRGYYASLLAGARGHRVMPSVETMIDLSERSLYENAIPELEDSLNRSFAGKTAAIPHSIRFYFGLPPEKHLERFGRLLFDWFRAPALEVTLKSGQWVRIQKIQLVPFHRIAGDERSRFLDSMRHYTSHKWTEARPKVPA